jgi:glycine betaine/proline transport system substrate-binding protein
MIPMRGIAKWFGIAAAVVVVVALFVYMYRFGPELVDQQRVTVAAPEQTTDQSAVPIQSSTKSIRLGWTAWADAEVVTSLAEKLLEQRMGYRVDRVMTDIGIQYQAVANGDLDIMLMAWLPLTHRNYWEKVRDKVVNLGPLYMGRLGWVVPDYVPKDQLTAISDLQNPEVAKKVGAQIQGIDPGSGLMQASERAMQKYPLDQLKLVSASGAAMTAVLDRAYRQQRWVVVTAWQPHWIFARYKLRFLEDPQRVLGGDERIHAIARQGFAEDFPREVTEFFTRMYFPDAELAAILLDAQENNVEDAVDRYIRQHPRRIHYWVTGEIKE